MRWTAGIGTVWVVTACQLSGAPPGETSQVEDDGTMPPPGENPPAGWPHSSTYGVVLPGGPEMPPEPTMHCVDQGGAAVLLDATDREVAEYTSVAECEQVLAAVGEGVVCAYFTPGMPVGPDGWPDETGWRPMNIETGMGLGRVPHESLDDCLEATSHARGGVVCTNTAVGYKSAHIETNKWCGASSNLHYCLEASIAARDHFVCSFPSSGDGSEPGWVLTEIAGTECNYLTSSMPLTDCNAMVPSE